MHTSYMSFLLSFCRLEVNGREVRSAVLSKNDLFPLTEIDRQEKGGGGYSKGGGDVQLDFYMSMEPLSRLCDWYLQYRIGDRD